MWKMAYALVMLILLQVAHKLGAERLNMMDLSLPPNRGLLNTEDDRSLFTIDLIHPHHVQSPYKYSNSTLSQRVAHSVESSAERWNYLAYRINGQGTTFGSEHELAIPVSYSGKGNYVVQITPGTQPSAQDRKLWVILDTGSFVSWVRCLKPGEQNDTAFNQKGSSSYAPILFESHTCRVFDVKEKSLSDPPTCIFSYYYQEGSHVKGELAHESFSFPNSQSKDKNAIKKMVFGCVDELSKQFDGDSGVLGIGPGPLSLISQLNVKTFSFCLVDYHSAKTVSNPILIGSIGDIPLHYTPLFYFPDPHMPLYYIKLKGISIAGNPVKIPPGAFDIGSDNKKDSINMIVDIGVTFTQLHSQLYMAFFLAIHESLMDSETLTRIHGHTYKLDLCYKIKVNPPAYPQVVFHFDNELDINISGKNTFLEIEKGEVACLAVRRVPKRPNVLGNIQLQNLQVGTDIGNNSMGFASHLCAKHGSK